MSPQIYVENRPFVLEQVVGDETFPHSSVFAKPVKQQNSGRFLNSLKRRPVPIRCDLHSISSLELNAPFGKTIGRALGSTRIRATQLKVKEIVKTIQKRADRLGFGYQVSIFSVNLIVHLWIQTSHRVKSILVCNENRCRLLLKVLDKNFGSSQGILIRIRNPAVNRLGRRNLFFCPSRRTQCQDQKKDHKD